MKKLFALLVCLAGLLVTVSSAHAEVFSFNATKQSNGNPPALGMWDVLIQRAGNSGATATWSINIKATTGALPNGDVSQISFGLFDGFDNDITFTPVLGQTAPGGIWSNDSFGFSTTSAGLVLRKTGTNAFSGSFTTASNVAVAKVTTLLQNRRQQWYGETAQSLAPEMPGAALLLPALLPVGLVLRKKRGVRSSLRNNTAV